MAYGRTVKMKEVDAEKLEAVVKYVGDECKRTCTDVLAFPFRGFFVSAGLFNRKVHGRTRDSCYFDHMILYLDDSWPKDSRKRQELGRSLSRVLNLWGFRYIERGYAVYGAVHGNTTRPHIHLLVDSCNWLKDQPVMNFIREGRKIINSLNTFLEEGGISERVESGFVEMTEEELFADENIIPEKTSAGDSDGSKIDGIYSGYSNGGMGFAGGTVPCNNPAGMYYGSPVFYYNPYPMCQSGYGLQGYIPQSELLACGNQFTVPNERVQIVPLEQKGQNTASEPEEKVMCTIVDQKTKDLYPTKEEYDDAKRKGLI